MEPLIMIPAFVPDVLGLLMLFVSAFLVETHYVGRLAMASNVFFTWQVLGPHWQKLPEPVQAYLNIGLLFAAVALVSYAFKRSLSTQFYNIGRLLFGALSVIVLFVYLYTTVL
jgi:hypothetical protein